MFLSYSVVPFLNVFILILFLYDLDIERTNATEWEVFMYLDISALPLVTLHVQEAPSHLKIKSYIIDVHRNWGSSSWTASSFTIPATDVKNGEIVLQYNARYKPGIYHFTVSLNHGRCGEHLKKCFVSTSPKFFVGEKIEDIF